jgi:hypothetical protein
MIVTMSRGVSLSFVSVFYLISFFILIIFSDSGYAENNTYGCTCSTAQIGSRGTCGSGQGCTNAPDQTAGLYCFANPAGGYPLRNCGEGCMCEKNTDCEKIAFAAKCISNRCYSPVNGILVEPLACPQQNAVRR